MPIKLKANNGNIDLKAPIKGGAVDSVNGMTGDVVLDIPSKTSDLVNDSGFLTQIPEEYITETELDAKGYLTEHQSLADYAKKSELFSKDYNDLTNKPTIPSVEGLASTQYVDEKVAAIVIPSLDGYATEQWVEGKGYLTQHQNLDAYALKSEIPTVPTNISSFTNDSGYLTLATLPKYTGGVE